VRPLLRSGRGRVSQTSRASQIALPVLALRP
jgi:hypothetical protein